MGKFQEKKNNGLIILMVKHNRKQLRNFIINLEDRENKGFFQCFIFRGCFRHFHASSPPTSCFPLLLHHFAWLWCPWLLNTVTYITCFSFRRWWVVVICWFFSFENIQTSRTHLAIHHYSYFCPVIILLR